MKQIRIGVIGAGWMCKAHSSDFKNVPLTHGPKIGVPVLEVVAKAPPLAALSRANRFVRSAVGLGQLFRDASNL